MTKYYSFISALCVLFIFSACQKEISSEDGNPGGNTSGTAVFTLPGSPGNCSGSMINGIFEAGTPADTSDKIIVNVSVTTLGTYNISSSTVNGISFVAAGTFISTGLQEIVLNATGTPIAPGLFSFTLGTGGCTFSINCTPGITPTDCKQCIYLPFCPGSQYEYADSIVNPITLETTVMPRFANLISSTDTTIEGTPYKKIQISDGTNNTVAYVNCSNGETTNISYNVQSTTSGNILVAIKSIELKANAPVGTTWSDTSLFAAGNTLYRIHTISEKGISRNVAGVDYPDVIKVTVDQSVLYTNPPVGLVNTGITEYYFARGTGLIETITYGENPINGETYTAYHSVLQSYLIP